MTAKMPLQEHERHSAVTRDRIELRSLTVPNGCRRQKAGANAAGRLLSRRRLTAAGVRDGRRESADGRAATDDFRVTSGWRTRSRRPKDKEQQCSTRPWTEETRLATTDDSSTRNDDRSITALATYSVGGDSSKIFGQFCLPSKFCSDPKISNETFRNLARNSLPRVMVLQS